MPLQKLEQHISLKAFTVKLKLSARWKEGKRGREKEREGERRQHSFHFYVSGRALQIEVILSVIYTAPIRVPTASP